MHEWLSTSQPRQTVSACNCIQPRHTRRRRVLTQLQSNTGRNQSAEHAAHQQSTVCSSSQEVLVFLTSASCYHVTFFIRAFGGFMVMWFIWACGTLMMPGSLACYPYSWTTVFGELWRWKEEEEGPQHVRQKSPAHKVWMVELPRPRVHMPVGTGPPVQTSHIPREKINDYKWTKKLCAEIWILNLQPPTLTSHGGDLQEHNSWHYGAGYFQFWYINKPLHFLKCSNPEKSQSLFQGNGMFQFVRLSNRILSTLPLAFSLSVISSEANV